MKDEGPSLRIDRFATEVESKVQNAERRQTLMPQARTYGEGWQCFRQHGLWQKAPGMCRRSKQGFYVQTSVTAILTNQRNHNS